MAKAIDLDGMTVKELRELLHMVDAKIVERGKTERADLRAKMEELAAESGLSLDEVLGTSRGRGKGSRSPIAVKYRNPENPDETWTGRGRKPNWLAAKMSKRGVQIEDFAV